MVCNSQLLRGYPLNDNLSHPLKKLELWAVVKSLGHSQEREREPMDSVCNHTTL